MSQSVKQTAGWAESRTMGSVTSDLCDCVCVCVCVFLCTHVLLPHRTEIFIDGKSGRLFLT